MSEITNISYIGEEYISTISKNPLIDKDKIIKTVEHYVENYRSKSYQEYKSGKMTNKIYSKIGKKYNLLNEDNFIKLVDAKTKKTIENVKKPKYLFIFDKLDELGEMKNILKKELDLEYNELLSSKTKLDTGKDKVNFKDRLSEFEKMKIEYIKLLENIEVYKLYYLIVNNVKIKDVKSIAHSKMAEYYNNDNLIFEKKTYKIPESLINDYIESQGDMIDKYNKLLTLMKTNEVKKKDIKNYLEESNKIRKNYKKEINKYLIDNEIDYIVTELPKII